MIDSVHALTDAELSAVRKACCELSPAVYHRERARGYLDIILRTGMHPSVLASPTTHNLTLTKGEEYYVLTWDRPKKKGVLARCESRMKVLAWRWLPTFIAQVQEEPTSKRSLQRLFLAVGEASGLPGRLTPRTLRHTAIDQAIARGLSVSDACAYFSVSPAIAIRYAQLRDRDMRDRVQRTFETVV